MTDQLVEARDDRRTSGHVQAYTIRILQHRPVKVALSADGEIQLSILRSPPEPRKSPSEAAEGP
jgi:hypothetical protein